MLPREGILARRSVKVGASSSSSILQPNDPPKEPRSYMLVGVTAPSQPIVVAGPPSVGHCTRLVSSPLDHSEPTDLLALVAQLARDGATLILAPLGGTARLIYT
jgi:hypothetical protein